MADQIEFVVGDVVRLSLDDQVVLGRISAMSGTDGAPRMYQLLGLPDKWYALGCLSKLPPGSCL